MEKESYRCEGCGKLIENYDEAYVNHLMSRGIIPAVFHINLEIRNKFEKEKRPIEEILESSAFSDGQCESKYKKEKGTIKVNPSMLELLSTYHKRKMEKGK